MLQRRDAEYEYLWTLTRFCSSTVVAEHTKATKLKKSCASLALSSASFSNDTLLLLREEENFGLVFWVDDSKRGCACCCGIVVRVMFTRD